MPADAFNPDDLPPLKEVIAAHGLRAKKSLGQNFLHDLNLTDKIVRAAGDLAGCHVIEIGPGPGGLTRSLLKTNAQKVTALEFDPRAVAALAGLRDCAQGRLEVAEGDALKTDLRKLVPETPRAVVANLPYNIATPLLTGWLRQIYDDPDCFRSLTLMFQKEVAQRLTAEAGSKAYGRLSVVTQWLCEIKAVFDLPPRAFTPSPKVTSSIVHLTPRMPDSIEPQPRPSFTALEQVSAAAFAQRRKMIRSSLKSYAGYFEPLGLDPQLRAENLSVETYAALARAHEEKNQ